MTREEFDRMNVRFQSAYGLTDSDYEKAKYCIGMIDECHKRTRMPQVGDIVEGAYYDGTHPYKYGLIEKVHPDGALEICYEPYIPFVYFDASGGICVSVSGGPFGKHKAEELELVSEHSERIFCDWGHRGGCANGAIYFDAPVRRWKIPYVRKSKTLVTLFKKDYQRDAVSTDYAGSCYIDSEWLGFRHQTFRTFDAFKKYAHYLGVTYEYWDDSEAVKRYRLSHDIKEMKSFWHLHELPEGVKPIKAMSNGSMVTCYFRTLEHDVEFYRPNPNAKEVYDVMPWEEALKVKREQGWA